MTDECSQSPWLQLVKQARFIHKSNVYSIIRYVSNIYVGVVMYWDP